MRRPDALARETMVILMKPENTGRLLDAQLSVCAAEVLGFIAQAPDDGQYHALSAQHAIDVMLVALATLIEADDEIQTPRDFRLTVEMYGSEMLTIAREFRKWKAEDGLHHFERMGGYQSDPAGEQDRPPN